MARRHLFVRNSKIEQQAYAIDGDTLMKFAQGELLGTPGSFYTDVNSSPPLVFVADDNGILFSLESGIPLPVDQSPNGYFDLRLNDPVAFEATTGVNVLRDPMKGLYWQANAGYGETIKLTDPPSQWLRSNGLFFDWVIYFQAPTTAMIGYGDRAFDVETASFQHFYDSGGAKLFLNGTTSSNAWYGKTGAGANGVGFMSPAANWESQKFFRVSHQVGPGSPGLGLVSIYEVDPTDWDNVLGTVVNMATVPSVGGNEVDLVPCIVPNGGSENEVYLAGYRIQ